MKKLSILFAIICMVFIVLNSFMISCSDDDDEDPTPTPTMTPTSEPEEITFIKNFGGPYKDWGLSAQVTNDKGYIITGSTQVSNEGIEKACLLKLDKYGNEIWFKTFGPHSKGLGRSIQLTSDNGYIVVGTSNLENIYVVKFDNDGNEMWSKIFLDDGFIKQGSSIQQTYDSGYIVLGSIYYSMTTDLNNKIYVSKIDQLGNEMWSNYYGLDDCLYGSSIIQLPDKNYIIAGTIDKSCNYDSRNYDAFSLKIDNHGDEIWMRTYGGNYYDSANCVDQLSDDGFILVGGQEKINGIVNISLIKTDLLGYEEWTRVFNFDGDDNGYFVEQTRDKGFIITGDTGSMDMFLLKTDANGVEQWSKKFGNDLMDSGNSVVQTDDGGYFVTGGFGNGIDGDINIFAVKTDKNGNI